MVALAKTILQQAIQLPADERAVLADELIESLAVVDPALDAIWLREAQARLAAYRNGELQAVDAEVVFADLGNHA
jgi:putative addiction module component (TIGR02574 family)